MFESGSRGFKPYNCGLTVVGDVDRMGFDGMEVNVVNHFVHGWWKAAEYQWFVRNYEFEQLHGYSTPETFRPRPIARVKNGRRRNLPYPGFRRFPTGPKKLG